MADQLYLSYWLRGFTERNMLRHYEAALRKFPFSALQPRAFLTVRAIDLSEPPLLEREYSSAISVDEIIEASRWFSKGDVAFEVETSWDLWDYGDGWTLHPAKAVIACFAPLFPSEYGEQIRIELGPDGRFLPNPAIEAGLAPVRQNIRSLLHLVKDLDQALTLEKRLLWSESGGNFAERLEASLAEEKG